MVFFLSALVWLKPSYALEDYQVKLRIYSTLNDHHTLHFARIRPKILDQEVKNMNLLKQDS